MTQKRKKVALFGGSFNPPHPAHFAAAKYLANTLGVDEVWMLFSQNRFKDPDDYVSIDHRIAMGSILKNWMCGEDLSIRLIDIEKEVSGSDESYNVLRTLSDKHANTDFVWVMGLDNMIDFHKWKNSDSFIQEYPIVILNRPGYEDAAMKSKTAAKYHRLRMDFPQDALDMKCGWFFDKDFPELDISSSTYLEKLKAGQLYFGNEFDYVAQYIKQHGLYGVKGQNALRM